MGTHLAVIVVVGSVIVGACGNSANAPTAGAGADAELAGTDTTIGAQSTDPELIDSTVGNADGASGTTQDRTAGVVTIRPVISCGENALPDVGLGQATLSVIDGSTCVVGPTSIADVFVAGVATAELNAINTTWVVNVEVRADVRVAWNDLASTCFAGGPDCPGRQLAIVVDDVIQSAPVVMTPEFSDIIQISGDFTESEAQALADAVNGVSSQHGGGTVPSLAGGGAPLADDTEPCSEHFAVGTVLTYSAEYEGCLGVDGELRVGSQAVRCADGEFAYWNDYVAWKASDRLLVNIDRDAFGAPVPSPCAALGLGEDESMAE